MLWCGGELLDDGLIAVGTALPRGVLPGLRHFPLTDTGAGPAGHAAFTEALVQRPAHLPPLRLVDFPFELANWPRPHDGLSPRDAGRIAAMLPALRSLDFSRGGNSRQPMNAVSNPALALATRAGQLHAVHTLPNHTALA